MKRSLKAGPDGLKAVEVFSPVRTDHLSLAGTNLSENVKVSFPDQGVTPSLKPATVYNLNEIQWTPLLDPDKTQTYKRSRTHSRLIWGKNVTLSFNRNDPNSPFPLHIHPEEQLMLTLRGTSDLGVMDSSFPISGEVRHFIFLPGGMAHGAKISETGADNLDVFWPVRPDYVVRPTQQETLFHEVIGPGVKPVKLGGGFTFADGPTWLKGKLYFSDMFFKDHRNGDWTGDPKRSRLISMDPNGEWKVLVQGMQTTGTIASRSSKLVVCDMFGDRVIEIDRKSGKIIRTVLDKVNGRPIDGPSDLIMDAKGGIYVSESQSDPEEVESQPGKQVYYLAPDGLAKVVIPPGEYAMPNGVEISPDGKTFYVNNTWFQSGEHFLWVYDIKEDGSLCNKRKFAMLNLTPELVSAKELKDRIIPRVGGMAVDTDGRIYVATLSGVQIFDKTGTYVGTIWCPQYPVSCTFGGKNNDMLYMVGESSAWVVQTKVKGFRLHEQN
jgi:gluconolactonase